MNTQPPRGPEEHQYPPHKGMQHGMQPGMPPRSPQGTATQHSGQQLPPRPSVPSPMRTAGAPQHPQQRSQQHPGQPVPPSPSHEPNGKHALNIRERRAFSMNGFLALLLLGAALIYGLSLVGRGISAGDFENDSPGPEFGFGAMLAVVSFILMLSCLTIVAPGTSKVVQFFGSYVGTIRAQGLRLTIPFSVPRTVSIKVRNFETNVLKVNDADGNPINIAAIVVWRVTDTAKAMFAVENFEQFVATQSEAALRHVTGEYPYDSSDPNQVTLLDSTAEVSDRIAAEVSSRIQLAGLEVIEARISALSYAPEIAPAMLQRQQASAVIAARERIVQGAVSIVQDALGQLEQDGMTHITPERRVDIISNMLVVLTSETRVTPVINTSAGVNHDSVSPTQATEE